MTHHAWGDQPGPAAAGPTSPSPAAGHEAPVGLAVAAGVLAIALTLVQVVYLVTSIPAAREFEDALRAGRLPDDVLTAYDLVILALAAVAIPTYVVTCLWLQFARTNSEVISPGLRHARGKVWVWLGWWVPIVSLWFPFQVVRDVQAASRPRGAQLGLGLWWTGWVVWLVTNRVTSSMASSTDPEVVADLPVVEGIGTAALMLACVQWCRLLQRITADQRTALAGPTPYR
ncbi:MAG TPA: DUF4328 domain-containing protein [Nocardioides sp.]|nr:DUF4328 domain-containing protein [Nocardioides sp.]